MWIYEKKLEYPVRVQGNDLRMAKYLMAQYGGPDSELSAGVRYLTQRYSMPTAKTKGLLTDIGTEELVPLCYQSSHSFSLNIEHMKEKNPAMPG